MFSHCFPLTNFCPKLANTIYLKLSFACTLKFFFFYIRNNKNHSMSFNIKLLSTMDLALWSISKHFSTGDFISNLAYLVLIRLKCET